MSVDVAPASFGSPEHGERIERLACDRHDLEHVDGPHTDARKQDGTPVQIKGCQVEHSNGSGETVPGRWLAWSGTLTHLLHDGGEYLVVVYDPDVDPDTDPGEYIVAERWLTAREFGQILRGYTWQDGHRPSKGDRARPSWTAVFDRAEVTA